MAQKLARISILLLIVLVLLLAPVVRAVMLIPLEVTQFEGEEQAVDINLPWGVQIDDSHGLLGLAEEVGKGFVLKTDQAGSYQFKFNLLGIIPLRTMQVNVIPRLKLALGGHSVGVRLSEYGVMVAGLDPVQTSAGIQHPARDSGFKPGDIILAVDDVGLVGLEHAAQVLEEKSRLGRELEFVVWRDGRELLLKVTPAYCQQSKKMRLGLLLRDTNAGVGTLTFYHPDTGIYGALGHMITDGIGSKPVDLSAGQIVGARVVSIQPGQKGNPGEKKGIFDGKSLGSIYSNSELGIFGRLAEQPDAQPELVPLGFKHQVKTGPAEIYTVINGDSVEKFTIEIEKVFVQNKPASKGMVIRVTDPRLLKVTGGIVQGMSGSPIIQDGKLVGAVTHVFINEPHRGYGCFAEWMVAESGLLEELQSTVPPKILEAFQ